MSILINTRDTADPEIQTALNEIIRQARTTFSPLAYDGAYPKGGFGVAELGPRHVGIANDFWQMTVTTSFANWINKNLGTDVFVLVTGIFNRAVDPATTAIQVTANGNQLPVTTIESLYATDQARGWFSEPFASRPSSNLTIAAIGKFAATEPLGLLGYVVAKRSYLINQSP